MRGTGVAGAAVAGVVAAAVAAAVATGKGKVATCFHSNSSYYHLRFDRYLITGGFDPFSCHCCWWGSSCCCCCGSGCYFSLWCVHMGFECISLVLNGAGTCQSASLFPFFCFSFFLSLSSSFPHFLILLMFLALGQWQFVFAPSFQFDFKHFFSKKEISRIGI